MIKDKPPPLVWVIYAEKHNLPIEHYDLHKDTVGYAFHKVNMALKDLKYQIKPEIKKWLKNLKLNADKK